MKSVAIHVGKITDGCYNSHLPSLKLKEPMDKIMFQLFDDRFSKHDVMAETTNCFPCVILSISYLFPSNLLFLLGGGCVVSVKNMLCDIQKLSHKTKFIALHSPNIFHFN